MWIPKARTSKFSTAFAERIPRESGTPRLSTRSSRAANCLRPAQVGVSVSGPSWGRGASQSGLMVSSKHHASWKRCRIRKQFAALDERVDNLGVPDSLGILSANAVLNFEVRALGIHMPRRRSQVGWVQREGKSWIGYAYRYELLL